MPLYPGTAMETAIARGGPSRLEVAGAPLNGPGGPQAGSLRFPGGFVCEKMRESQSACKELVNTRRADLRRGGAIALGPVFIAAKLSWLLAPGSALSLHAQMGICCKNGIFGGVLWFLPSQLSLAQPPAARLSKICLRCKPLDGSAAKRAGECVCVPIRAPRPFLPDHPIAGEARGGGCLAPDTLVLGFLLLLL